MENLSFNIRPGATLPCRRCGNLPSGVLQEMIGEHLVALKLQCARGCVGSLRRRRAGTLPDVEQARDQLVRRWDERHELPR